MSTVAVQRDEKASVLVSQVALWRQQLVDGRQELKAAFLEKADVHKAL